jgi:hypothetical protein
MRMGSFLLGGMVGAAVVVYMNTKNKAMLLSAFSGNNSSMGSTMSKAKERITSAFDNDKWKGGEEATSSSGNSANSANTANTASSANSTNSTSNHKDGYSGKSNYGKIEEIINNEPQLKATVEEILAETQHKEMHAPQ